MDNILVTCNHCKPSETPKTVSVNKRVSINASSPGKNLQLNIDNITHKILNELKPLAQDLLEISSYIYYADCSINRGSDKDVYAERWRRNFTFVIPVSNPDLWNRADVKDCLIDILKFLSDDEFSFFFLPPKPVPVQLYIKFPDIKPPHPDANCISLFSGGIDSLIGSLYILKEKKELPLLVSHRSQPKVDSLQKGLLNEVRKKNQEWEFPQLSIWINRMGNRSEEATQRTRSFLFLSIATAIAIQLGIAKIYICENGIVSMNLPISDQNVGTFLTRSTHPKILKLFEQFVQNLFDFKIHVENPFIFHTKTEMLGMLKGWGQRELIQESISCSLTQGRTKIQPQCGTCFQCVNRRFSVIASGLEEYDRQDYYGKDIFIDSLNEGRDRAVPVSYVRSAIEIRKMNDVQFFARYPELDEVVGYLDMSPDQAGQGISELYQRHAQDVMDVISFKYYQHLKEHLEGKLPKNCLISMLASGIHLENPLDDYADKIGKLLNQAIRIDFQTDKPINERRVQESAQAALSAADEPLRRESPLLSYSIVQTKPDFSNIPNFSNLLFIEIKFIGSKERLSGIVKDITSRITIYRDQGAYVLFVVYDSDGFIIDDDEFIRDFEKHEKIRVKIIR
jgi:7-cyano-7-deazaguanine synthase in queuosine biosynthesis